MKKSATPFNQHPVAFSRSNGPEVQRDEVEQAIQEFLKRGGTIQQVQVEDAPPASYKVNFTPRWMGADLATDFSFSDRSDLT